MTRITVTPQQLREAAQQFRAAGQESSQMIARVEQQLSAMQGDWAGLATTRFDQLYQQMRPRILEFPRLLAQIQSELEKAAARFEVADQGQGSQAGAAAGLSALPATGAAVLGASTSDLASLMGGYRNMEWKDRFQEQIRIEDRIKALESQLKQSRPVETIDQEINLLDTQITELEQKHADAKKNADDLLNNILPSKFPPDANDGDGNPLWRSKTDDYEDEMAGYDQQLEALRTQRQGLVQERDTTGDFNTELLGLKDQQTALRAVMDEGVKTDGPTNASLRGQLVGCTHYVAEKRNVAPWPNSSGEPGHPRNATEWNDQAAQAGYEVGSLPAKGSIIVFEGGYDPDGTGKIEGYGSGGHVGYVEKVTRVEGGYEIEFSHASVVKNSAGVNQVGTHKMNSNAPKFIPDSGIDKVSFIYGKKS